MYATLQLRHSAVVSRLVYSTQHTVAKTLCSCIPLSIQCTTHCSLNTLYSVLCIGTVYTALPSFIVSLQTRVLNALYYASIASQQGVSMPALRANKVLACQQRPDERVFTSWTVSSICVVFVCLSVCLFVARFTDASLLVK